MTSFSALTKFHRSPIFKHITYVILLCFTVLLCNSCVSIKVAHLPIMTDYETPSIAMRMYLENPDSEEMDQIFNGVQSSLSFKNDTGKYIQISTSKNGQWFLKNAPAGTYQLKLADSFEHDGKIVNLSGDRVKIFRLPAGKRAEIQIILKKTPVGLIIVLSVVIVGLIILAILASHDLPDIPIPPKPPSLILPLPPIGLPLPLHLFFPPVPPLHAVGPLPPIPLFIDQGIYIAPQPASQSHEEDKPEATTPEVVQ